MLDENLPTYRFRTSSENPLHTLLYYTHNGSEPSADYLIKRPPPTTCANQYALGLFDIQYASVLYAEILLKPEWSQPTLSAAEVRANGNNPPPAVPLTPHTFSVSLYNPDQTISVKYQQGSWSKDAWEFEVPETSFHRPSQSKIDQDTPASQVSELTPKVNFRWKRDGRMSRDMTCYMSGKTVGGKKNKEPDITVALFKAGKNDGAVAIYEPNMNRVDVEDRKGLEVIMLLSAEVIRDLFLSPRQDPFNTAGAPPPSNVKIANKQPAASGPSTMAGANIPAAGLSGAAMSGAAMSGAMANARPSSSPPKHSTTTPGPDARMRADVEAEKKRRQAMIDQNTSKEKKLQREQDEIKRMLEREEREESERRRREAKEREKRVNKETQALLKQYGPQPKLPPRPSPAGGSGSGGAAMSSGAASGWFGPPNGATQQPPRAKSVEPGVRFAEPQQQNGSGAGKASGTRQKLGNFLQNSPYTNPVASSSGFFGGNAKAEQKKAKKKQSTHF